MSSAGNNAIDIKLQAFHTAAAITNETTSDLIALVESNLEDSEAAKCCDEFMKLSLDFVTSLERLCSIFTIDIVWVPPSYIENVSSDGSSQELELIYADGSSPWSFWLAFQVSQEYESLCSMLQEDLNSGSLKRLNSVPNPGSFVICVDRNNVFRAVVLSTNSDKIRVRNVDSPFVKVVKLDNLYIMPRKFCSVNAQTVQCCLTEDESLRTMWNSDLNELFRNTVKSCRLKVRFLRLLADSSVVPRYLVSMTSSDNLGVSFDDWICCKMLPELTKYKDDFESFMLENLPENVLDPFYVEDLHRNNPDDEHFLHVNSSGRDVIKTEASSTTMASAWSPQLFLPPNPMMLYQELSSRGGSIAAQYTTTAVFTQQSLDQNANQFPIPHQVTTTSSFIVKPSTLNADTPVFEPRRTIEIKKPLQIEDKKPEITFISTQRNGAAELSADAVEVCPMYSKNGFCLASACSKKHVRLDVNLLPPASKTPSYKTDQTDNGLISASIEKCDSVTSSHVNGGVVPVETAVHNDEDYDDDDDGMEEPCITGGYIPTDESRLCQFPSHNGVCWKKHCYKEHEDQIPDKWTSDKIKTRNSLFNELDLPQEGETVELIVTCVVNSFTFYSRLPNIYSDIGEGTPDIETFKMLHTSINDPKNVRNYVPFPSLSSCESELCLVLSSDHSWKRARVIEDKEKTIRVIYLDYGFEEDVRVDALKILEDRFCHLPAQAVLCTLSGLYYNPQDLELTKRGRSLLENQIKGKVITGKVVSSYNSELDLIVTCNGCNINSLMVNRGMCEQL